MDNAATTTEGEDESIVTRLKRRSNAKQLDFKHLLKKCSSSDCDCHHQNSNNESSPATSTATRSLRTRNNTAPQPPPQPQQQSQSKDDKVTKDGKKIRCQVQGRNVVVDETDYNKYIRHGKWQSGEFFRYELQSKSQKS